MIQTISRPDFALGIISRYVSRATYAQNLVDIFWMRGNQPAGNESAFAKNIRNVYLINRAITENTVINLNMHLDFLIGMFGKTVWQFYEGAARHIGMLEKKMAVAAVMPAGTARADRAPLSTEQLPALPVFLLYRQSDAQNEPKTSEIRSLLNEAKKPEPQNRTTGSAGIESPLQASRNSGTISRRDRERSRAPSSSASGKQEKNEAGDGIPAWVKNGLTVNAAVLQGYSALSSRQRHAFSVFLEAYADAPVWSRSLWPVGIFYSQFDKKETIQPVLLQNTPLIAAEKTAAAMSAAQILPLLRDKRAQTPDTGRRPDKDAGSHGSTALAREKYDTAAEHANMEFLPHPGLPHPGLPHPGLPQRPEQEPANGENIFSGRTASASILSAQQKLDFQIEKKREASGVFSAMWDAAAGLPPTGTVPPARMEIPGSKTPPERPGELGAAKAFAPETAITAAGARQIPAQLQSPETVRIKKTKSREFVSYSPDTKDIPLHRGLSHTFIPKKEQGFIIDDSGNSFPHTEKIARIPAPQPLRLPLRNSPLSWPGDAERHSRAVKISEDSFRGTAAASRYPAENIFREAANSTGYRANRLFSQPAGSPYVPASMLALTAFSAAAPGFAGNSGITGGAGLFRTAKMPVDSVHGIAAVQNEAGALNPRAARREDFDALRNHPPVLFAGEMPVNAPTTARRENFGALRNHPPVLFAGEMPANAPAATRREDSDISKNHTPVPFAGNMSVPVKLLPAPAVLSLLRETTAHRKSVSGRMLSSSQISGAPIVYRKENPKQREQPSFSPKINEDIEFIKETVRHPPAVTRINSVNAAVNLPGASPNTAARQNADFFQDMDRQVNTIAEKVYSALERRLRSERMRKGLF